MKPKRRLGYLCLEKTFAGQGSRAHVHEIIAGLRQRGWHVELFEPERDTRRLGRSALLQEFLRTQRRLQRCCPPIDLLYVRSHFLSFPTALWARRRGIPTVHEVNGPFSDLFVSKPWTRWIGPVIREEWRQQLRWSDGIIVVSGELEAWVGREVGAKVLTIIPNGANSALFRPDAESAFSMQSPYALLSGNLALWQGVETALDAVRQPEWPADLNLLVVGDGQCRGLVEQAVSQGRRTRYIGVVPYEDMPAVIAASVAVLSIKNTLGKHNSPLKVYEALACGVPVVVTDFAAQADIVRANDCGIVVPANDAGAVARAVAALYADPEWRRAMGRRGRAVVVREHSWDQRAQSTHEFLLEVMTRHRQRFSR